MDKYAGRRVRRKVTNFIWSGIVIVALIVLAVVILQKCTPWFNMMRDTIQ